MAHNMLVSAAHKVARELYPNGDAKVTVSASRLLGSDRNTLPFNIYAQRNLHTVVVTHMTATLDVSGLVPDVHVSITGQTEVMC